MAHDRPGTAPIGWFLPAALLVGVVMVYPALRTLVLTFQDVSLKSSFSAEFAGLSNYIRLFSDSRFHGALWVTALFTILSVVLEFGLGLLMALAVDSLLRGRSLVRTIFLIPWALPTAVIGVLWAWIFNDQFGVLNSVLVRTGVLSAPISWLGEPTTAMAALIAADVWKTTPFVFIILLAGLQSIPLELYEALEMDGGGRWAKFRFVTWPFLSRFVFVAVIFRVIQAFSMFDLVYVMTGGGPGGATETLSLYAYQTMMRYLDFSYAATLAVAAVLALTVIALVLYILVVKQHEESV